MNNNQQNHDDLLAIFVALGQSDEYFPTRDEDISEALSSVLGVAVGLVARRTVTELSDDDVQRYLDAVLEVFDLAGAMRAYYDNHYSADTAEARRDQLISLLLALETVRNG